VTFVAVVAVLVVAATAPGTLIWVLGPKYQGLRNVLTLALAGGLTYVLSATIFLLNNAKAWIEQAWIAIPLTIALQLIGILILDLSTVRGALIFGWLSVAPPLFVNSVIAVMKFRRLLNLPNTHPRPGETND
jgi:hypothetical protein